MRWIRFSGLAVLLFITTPLYATQVFYTDFESGIPPEISSLGASVQGTQGYGGLANPVNTANLFGSKFLRYDSTGIQTVSLSLSSLPAHNSVNIGMLLAVIDSWDGTERLEIRLDGQLIFANTWSLALSNSSSYVAPAGGLLSSNSDLGFSSGIYYNRDRAYDLSLDPAFTAIPHTAGTLTLQFVISSANAGPAAENWQGGADESWAIDNLSIALNGASLTGDLNGDGFVGINDLNIILSNWNQNVAPGQLLFGDPSGDGFVGIEDLNTVLGNWNAGTPPAEQNVPEPAGLFALALAASTMCRTR